MGDEVLREAPPTASRSTLSGAPSARPAQETKNVPIAYDERMHGKVRLTASVDAEQLASAREAVATGRADSVSAWVNEAMRRQGDHEQRLAALAAFVADYEAEYGAITEAEMRDASRWARSRAVVVRGDPS